MLERLILETKERHSKRPISQEVYNKWRASSVTRRLFEELELAVVDSFQEYLDPSDPALLMHAMERQGAARIVESVIQWAPEGVEAPGDED